MKTQWQLYKELELIPDSVPPSPHSPNAILWLVDRWRSFTHRSEPPLYYGQQIKHLETCLTLDGLEQTPRSNPWQILWQRFSQAVVGLESLTSCEPEIRQVSDQGGQVWWYAHDPLTGQTTYLESETDVQIWLEERLYYNYR